MKTFFYFYKGTLLHPQTTFAELIRENKLLLLSFYAVLITAITYTLVYVFLIQGGGMPFMPWLNIDPIVYYRYNVFFCAPSMFCAWVLAAGVVHLLSKFFAQAGSFEQIVCVFGFGISIATWSTGIHDLLTSFLGAIHVISQRAYEHDLNSNTVWRALLWIQMSVYLVWFIILFTKGTKIVYKTGTFHSVLLGSIGFIVYQLFFLIFNR